jgi:hypothetical protein
MKLDRPAGVLPVRYRLNDLAQPVRRRKLHRDRHAPTQPHHSHDATGFTASVPAHDSWLRRENAELAMERDVLKRSVVLWVK